MAYVEFRQEIKRSLPSLPGFGCSHSPAGSASGRGRAVEGHFKKSARPSPVSITPSSC